MTSYAELDAAEYTRLHRNLLAEKGSDFQCEFLNAVKDSEDFLSIIDREVSKRDGEDLELFSGPLTEQSFKEPTKDQEQLMFATWDDVSPRIACRISFWAEVTLAHIRSEMIAEPYWLAANGGKTEGGDERIDRALAMRGDSGNRLVDDCVRTVIRRMSGLPHVRGNRSVFVNPSFGRGWWRERLIANILQRPGVEDRQDLLEVVRASQQYWENLVTMIVSRGSVFGSRNVQDALVNSLAKHFKENPHTRLRTANGLTRVLRRFSNVAASREIGVLEFDEIGEILDTLILQVWRTYQ